MTITDSEFYNNEGYEGGVFVLDNNSSLTASSSEFYNNSANANGGVLSATKTALSTL